MGKYEDTLKHNTTLSTSSKNTEIDLFVQLFRYSLKQDDKYYKIKIYELNKTYVLLKNEDTELLCVAICRNDAEMANTLINDGADIHAFDSLSCTSLEIAIRCNNFEMVSMLLYYGGYQNNIKNNLTSFMISIICQSSENIQRLLMEYETDYNWSCDGEPILFMAIKYHSPLIFELIERGANPSYVKHTSNGPQIAVLEAILYRCDVEVVRVS